MKMLIIRTAQNDFQTIGTGLILDNSGQTLFDFRTLELAFRNNMREISSIPSGKYRVEKRTSVKYGSHFHVLGVSGRTLILIHVGNYHINTKGCILVGREHKHLNTDKNLDVANSLQTMKKLNTILPLNFDLEIVEIKVNN